MSYANGTPFLNLAQTVGTDHRDWFDENAAKLDLDTKMKTLWDRAADTATILESLQESVSSLDTDVTTLEGVVSGHTSTITTINESLVLINTALNALNTQVTNKFDSAGIADPYDATHGTYDVGDVVTYNGQRYVCNTAVTAAEPFDVSKWTAEDIQTVLDGTKHDIMILGTKYGEVVVKNGIATLNCNFPNSVTVSDTVLYTLPEGFRPADHLYFTGRGVSSGNAIMVNTQIFANGAIVAYTVTEGDVLNAVYPVA